MCHCRLRKADQEVTNTLYYSNCRMRTAEFRERCLRQFMAAVAGFALRPETEPSTHDGFFTTRFGTSWRAFSAYPLRKFLLQLGMLAGQTSHADWLPSASFFRDSAPVDDDEVKSYADDLLHALLSPPDQFIDGAGTALPSARVLLDVYATLLQPQDSFSADNMINDERVFSCAVIDCVFLACCCLHLWCSLNNCLESLKSYFRAILVSNCVATPLAWNSRECVVALLPYCQTARTLQQRENAVRDFLSIWQLDIHSGTTSLSSIRSLEQQQWSTKLGRLLLAVSPSRNPFPQLCESLRAQMPEICRTYDTICADLPLNASATIPRFSPVLSQITTADFYLKRLQFGFSRDMQPWDTPIEVPRNIVRKWHESCDCDLGLLYWIMELDDAVHKDGLSAFRSRLVSSQASFTTFFTSMLSGIFSSTSSQPRA